MQREYGGGQLKIDKIAKSFNTPNNKVESIAKWIELSSGNDSDVKKKGNHSIFRLDISC